MSRAQDQGGQLGFDALLSAASDEKRRRKVERETAHLPGTMKEAIAQRQSSWPLATSILAGGADRREGVA